MKSATRKQTKGTPMNQPLESLEDLILASLNPRAITGLPHPLSKFAANGMVKEGPYADAIIEFIKDWTLEVPESVKQGAAMWFLFQSERAFFVACSEAGIDAERLRNHLRQRLSAEKNE
jgi:hypothetical protein